MSKLFQRATREQSRLRMTLDGPAGSGKTFTGLRFATALAIAMKISGGAGRIAVVNTESGSIGKYLGDAPDGVPFDFDIITLKEFAPSSYTSSILAAAVEGYDVILIDSLSHAWEGKGGALDQVDRASDRNKFTGWKDVTPQNRKMVDSILDSPCHVITTMRTKTEYVLEPDDRGKMVPRRVGMKPIQREGMDYEFDIVCDLNQLHVLSVSKTRCHDIDGLVVMKPGADFMVPVIKWLRDGSAVSADHFKVRESDMKAWEESERAEAAREPKKPVDFRAKLTGGPASGTLAGTPSADAPCTDNQAVHIRGLAGQIEMPVEQLKAVLAKRNAFTIKELTYGQAETLIDGLLTLHKKHVEQKRAEQDVADAEAKRKAAEDKKMNDEVPF